MHFSKYVTVAMVSVRGALWRIARKINQKLYKWYWAIMMTLGQNTLSSSSCNLQVIHGSVETHRRWGGKFSNIHVTSIYRISLGFLLQWKILKIIYVRQSS